MTSSKKRVNFSDNDSSSDEDHEPKRTKHGENTVRVLCGHSIKQHVDVKIQAKQPCAECTNKICVMCQDPFPFHELHHAPCFKCKVCISCLNDIKGDMDKLTQCPACDGLFCALKETLPAPASINYDEKGLIPKRIIDTSVTHLKAKKEKFAKDAELVHEALAKDLERANLVVDALQAAKSRFDKTVISTTKTIDADITAYESASVGLNQAAGIELSQYATDEQKQSARAFLKSVFDNHDKMYPAVDDKTLVLPTFRFDPLVMPTLVKLDLSSPTDLDLDLDESKFVKPAHHHQVGVIMEKHGIPDYLNTLIVVPTTGPHYIYVHINYENSKVCGIGSDDHRLQFSKIPAFFPTPAVERIVGPNATIDYTHDKFKTQVAYYNTNGYLVLGGKKGGRTVPTHHYLNSFEVRNKKGRLVHLNCGKYSIHQVDEASYEIRGPFTSFVFMQPSDRQLLNSVGLQAMPVSDIYEMKLTSASAFDNRALLKYNYNRISLLFLVEPSRGANIKTDTSITRYFNDVEYNALYVMVSRKHVIKVSLDGEWFLELMEMVRVGKTALPVNERYTLVPLFKVRNTFVTHQPSRRGPLLCDAYVGTNNTFVVRTDKFTLVY